MAPVPLSQRDNSTPFTSSPPSSPNSSSDKENPRRSAHKRFNSQMASSSQGPKRRRLTDRASNIQTRAPPSSQRHDDRRYYDPDQDEGERRRTRKRYRDLAGDFNDSRAEYLQSGNDGIYQTVVKANRLFENVKQTSDATIDSRLLVNAADLSHKKTARLALGDTNAGIDVDEFVSKCISFMRRGPDVSNDLPSSTQNRRRHRRSQPEADSDDEDQGDAMNWDWLGRMACLPKNARPSVTGFLLGPLSVQKRTRQVTQRINREAPDATQAVQPRTLEQEDLDQREDSNLTEMCTKINRLLSEWQDKAQKAADEEINQLEDCTEEMARAIIDRHSIADDGGVPLFRFCINSKSFGQSVENLFYVSFLVRDGTVGLAVDQQGLPTLHASNPYAPREAQEKGIQKHQAVFSLDFDTWENLIDVFNLKDSSCIIPHREELDQTNQTWYG